MMNKKGSLELSVNAIVILIIALAILGLVIGFAVSKFNDLSGDLESDEETPDATAQQPITFPGGTRLLTLQKGEADTIEIGVYNSGVTNVTTNMTFNCVPTDVTGTFNSAVDLIGPGENTKIPVALEVDSSVAPGEKSCTFTIGNSTDAIKRTVMLKIQ